MTRRPDRDLERTYSRAQFVAKLRRGTTTCAIVVGVLLGCSAPTDSVGAPEWTLRESVRIGGDDDGPTSFSWIKGLAETPDGRLYVYEQSTQDIRVFDADGRHVRTIGRRGSGPGELRNAEGIVFGPDGALWVRDAANGRFSRFDADGTPLDGWAMTWCSSQGTWSPLVTGERIVDVDCIPSAEDDAEVVLAYRSDRSGVDTLGRRAACGSLAQHEAATWITPLEGGGTRYRPIPWAPRPVVAIDGTGATWCAASSGQYVLLRVGRDGDTVRVARDVSTVPVAVAERDSVIADIESRGPTGVDFSRLPSVKPMIERLTVDDQNRLWVRRDLAADTIAFDVITADGTLEATVMLRGVRTSSWSPFVVRGDVVLLVIVDADGVPQVGRFVIERGS